ncbi:MAG: hypothetical protein OK474_11670 [Thaumarchaeota archaeon]|nr:hypothetical protein [Nitrososphaerota archaeon]
MVEEGLDVKSWFSPQWGALGFLISIAILSLDILAGPPFVGFALAASLFALRRRLQSRPIPAPRQEATPAPILEHGS